jgi:predicted MFS family arabinose efflux permease
MHSAVPTITPLARETEVKFGKSVWAVLMLLQVISLGSVQTQPVFTGGLADLVGLTLQQIGVVFSAELLTAAATCTLVAMMVHPADRRRVLQWGLVAVVVGTFANAIAGTFASVTASRIIVGLGIGAVQAVMYATIAGSGQAACGYGMVSAAALFWGPLTVIGSTFLLRKLGIPAFLTQFALLAAIALAASSVIPRSQDRPTEARQPHSSRSGSPEYRTGLTAFLLLACIGLVLLGHQVVWVYQERIGRAIGLDPQTIGLALAAALITGGLGSALAALLGRRLGYWLPQVIGFGGSIIATMTMAYGQSVFSYALSACAVMGVWFFGLPYLFALAAQIDPSGRLPALGASASTFGQALAPAVAAAAVGSSNFRALGWVSATIYVVCLILAGTPIRRHVIARAQRAA